MKNLSGQKIDGDRLAHQAARIELDRPGEAHACRKEGHHPPAGQPLAGEPGQSLAAAQRLPKATPTCLSNVQGAQ